MQRVDCLKPNEGIPSALVALLAVMAGVSVANLYYCQPLLNLIREDIGLTEFQVNLMPVFTQIGYALGLLFIIPMGDLYNRRTTILTCFGALFFSLLTIAFSNNVILLLVSSFVTGVFSVAPQIFIPVFSHRRERAKSRIDFVWPSCWNSWFTSGERLCRRHFWMACNV